MAESADFNNSAQYVNFNVTNLDRDAFIFYKYNLNLSYDGTRLKWNNTFKELQEFFQNTVGLNGKWISPGGSSKRYIDADFDLIANWYPGKQNSLLFQGKDGSLLREFLTNLFTQVAVLNCPDETQSEPDNIVTIRTMLIPLKLRKMQYLLLMFQVLKSLNILLITSIKTCLS